MRGGATTPTPSRPAAFLNNYGNAAAMHRLASLTSSGLAEYDNSKKNDIYPRVDKRSTCRIWLVKIGYSEHNIDWIKGKTYDGIYETNY